MAPAGKKIRLEVLMLETEPQKDFLYLFNGTGTADPILAKLSGEGPIPVITSWNNQVLLWFVTDERNHFDGWTIRWEVVD